MFSGESESVRVCVCMRAYLTHSMGTLLLVSNLTGFLNLHPICERKTVLLSNVSFYSQVAVWRGART